jgi:hypothetical protein
MAITIDNKEYDENDLDNNVKNSINQVQNSNQQIAGLQAEILNHQILVKHHSQFIQENLPADEEGEAPVEAADVGSDDESTETDSE